MHRVVETKRDRAFANMHRSSINNFFVAVNKLRFERQN
jgi:hypothetical protein